MAEPMLPSYTHPNRIGYFHPAYNISPSKAAKMLNKAGAAHNPKRKAKVTKGHVRAVKAPSDGRGAKVFGGKR